VNDTEELRTFITENGVPADLTEQLLVAYPDDFSVNVIASLGEQRPGPEAGAEFRRSASYFGDQWFIATRQKTAQTWAAANLTAYSYQFNAIPAGLPPVYGVTHFQEVAFVFLNLEGVGYAPLSVSTSWPQLQATQN
jgi:acetylcholinesterase